jgi:hypothetical protein
LLADCANHLLIQARTTTPRATAMKYLRSSVRRTSHGHRRRRVRCAPTNVQTITSPSQKAANASLL